MSFKTKLSALLDPARPISLAAMGAIVVATLLADQATKLAALAGLTSKPFVVLIPNLLNLAYAENTGAAFSVMTGNTALLSLISTGVALFILIWAIRLPPAERGLRIAMGLILGGAIGNLIDRIRLGHVVDFIQAHWFWKHFWPTFNIADSAICIGVGMLIVATLLAPKETPAAPAAEAERR